LSGAALLALLPACAGGGTGGLAPAALGGNAFAQSLDRARFERTSALRPDVRAAAAAARGAFTGRPLDLASGNSRALAVSDSSNNVVDIFDAAGKQTAQLTGFNEPQGLAGDAKGNLYVANTLDNNIYIYKKFQGAPTILFDAAQYPAGVAVDAHGNLGVTNITTAASGPGSVTFYDAGGKQGSTLTAKAFLYVYFGGFDASGNLYIDGLSASQQVVVGEVVGGASGKSITVLTTGNKLQYPGGVNVATSGNICIDDQGALAVYCYAPPKNGSLGKPVSTTHVPAAGDPVTFAFTTKETAFYTADAGQSSAKEFAFPAGGAPLKTIPVRNSSPIGVALNPAAPL
jgi:sugar lactone lactonase YvrE